MRSTLNLFAASLRFGRPYIGRIALAAVLNLITVAADLGFLYLLKNLVDTGFASQNLARLKWLALGAMGILIFRSASGYLSGYLATYLDGRMTKDVQGALYEKIQKLPMEFHVDNSTGKLMMLIFYHTQSMLQLITSISGTLVRELLRIPALAVFLVSLHPGLAAFALVVIPPAFLGIRFFRKMITRAVSVTHESLAQLYTTTEETLANIEIVKTFAKETAEAEKFFRQNENLLLKSVQEYKAGALSEPFTQLLKMFGVTILVFLGTREVSAGNLGVGGLTAFLASAYYLYSSISSLATWYLALHEGTVSAEKVFEVLDATPASNHPEKGPRPFSFEKEITLNAVSFRYPTAAKDALCRVGFTIRKGETIGITGPSGSGKSTLVKLLVRLYETTGGDILIDGANTADMETTALRNLFGIAPQIPGIFQKSVGEAIQYGQPDATTEATRKAAQIAGAHDFISRLPHEYQTRIGKQGLTLSGGEKQRLALARALLRNPQILVLDEALSSVDAPTEKEILQRVANRRQGLTTILISHRLASIAHAKRIFIFENGALVESGSHQELVAGNTKYRTYFLAQETSIDEITNSLK